LAKNCLHMSLKNHHWDKPFQNRETKEWNRRCLRCDEFESWFTVADERRELQILRDLDDKKKDRILKASQDKRNKK